MKTFSFIHGRIVFFLFLIGIVSLMTGCIAELGLEAEALGEIAEADLVGAEAVAGAEDIASLRGVLAESSAAEATATGIESANTLLGRVRLARAYGESPKLYFEGKSSPFGEVYPKSGKFRLLNSSKYYSMPDNIFSVEGGTVRIRSSAQISSNNIITTVNKGDLIVKLAEENGWYQVKCVKNSNVHIGWIKATYALPVVLLDDKEKRKDNFKHPDESKIKIDLIGKEIPGWRFDQLSEIQNIQIKNEAIKNDYLVLTVGLKLKGAYTSDQYDSEVEIMYYNPNNQGWEFLNVASKLLTKIPSNNQSNLNSNENRPNNTNNGVPIKNSYTDIISNLNGNYKFISNVTISRKISGRFTLETNISCIVNKNGEIYGDVILNKGATLTIYGYIAGIVHNYGGKVIDYTHGSVRVINHINPVALPLNRYVPAPVNRYPILRY